MDIYRKQNRFRTCRWALAGMLLVTGRLSATPVTTDLWDSSQSGFSGPSTIGGSGSFCGAPVNIFGGSGNTGCGATFSDTFDALGFSSLSIRWNTSEVTVGSFLLYSPSDFSGGSVNEIVGIRLYTLDSNNLNPVLFYDSGAISHNPANDGTTPLLAVTLGTPVTSSNWRLDIIDQPSAAGAPIYRIMELDAFAPSTLPADVPEPASLILVAAGIGAIGLVRRRNPRGNQ